MSIAKLYRGNVNKIYKTGIFLLLAIFLFTLVFAITLPDLSPSISLSASDNNVVNTVVLTATAVDTGGNAGISWINIYENGNLLEQRQCNGQTTCVFVKTVVHNQAGTYSYFARTRDLGGNEKDSSIVIVNFAGLNQNPTINSYSPSSPAQVNEGSNLQFSVSASDPDGDALSYVWKLDNAQVSTSSSFTYSPDFFSQGTHDVLVIVSDGKGGVATMSWTVNVINVLIPTSCSLSFSPSSPIIYTRQPFTAYCSCNSQEASASLSRNGQDVTNEIGRAVTLPAGSYGYVCSVPQTANYASSSASSNFVINRAQTILNLNSVPSWNVMFGTQTTVSCTANNNEVALTLSRNGQPVSNPDVQTLAVGSYNYNCAASQSQNWSSATLNNALTVSALPDTQAPALTIVSPENITYTASDVLINITAVDNIAVDSVWYSIDGGANSTYTTPILQTLGDGPHLLEAWANDTSGNEGYASVNFEINTSIPDTEAPTIVINSPTNITYNVNNILIDINTTDNIAVDSVWYDYGTGNITYTTPLMQFFADGTYTLIVYANDTSGNENNSQVTFTVNTSIPNQPPLVELISPADGFVSNIENITLAYNVTDDLSNPLT